jgi:2-hydroxy-6-oxonona-2,4-dienedioate hydrolase
VAESLWTDLLGVEYAQRFYDVRGVRTRVLEAGDPDAPPLVFLHGVNGHAETYTRNIGPHARHFRVFSVDMIGHGLSDKPLDRDYEIATYVDHVLDFFDTLGYDRVLLSGESLGGWVSARLVIKHPDRVERLVLNTPGGLNAEPEVMARLKKMTLDAVSPPTREKVQARLEWLFKDKAMVPPDLVETRFRIYSQPGYREATERILCLQEMEVRQRNMLRAEDLNAISVPTLLVWSTADPIAGMDVGYWTRDNIPDCELVVMEHSGHWPQFEEPDKFNREHLRFLGIGEA